ncbi:MAG: Nif3-like dinuclear metal center hexameric protein [Pseudobutyrivibrio sp.]|nr:Nif3-like dinuclear metal center hexameric protein [Pseudobutyrivibrio sp.]
MKNKDVVDAILRYHPKLIAYQGCDGYKCGDPEAECTGVAVALVPTAEVIKKAAEANCNLLIVHEPIFYQTPDFDCWKGSFSNRIYEEKKELIEETHMTVWRDHDHMHANIPDSIFSGVIKYLGWEEYYEKQNKTTSCFIFNMPETRVGDIAEHLKKTLNLNGIKYMGNLDNTVHKVALVGHLFPNSFMEDGIKEDGFYHDYAMDIMQTMEEQGVQLIIPGEIIEWTVLSYIRDAVAMGKNMGCLSIGHFNLEELGMKDFATVIDGLINTSENNKLLVKYIPTEDGFYYA